MREKDNLEFKESISNTFLKTVSAYANYGTGRILFGVTDDGENAGIENPQKVCLDIENRINDSLDPVPFYTLDINDDTSVITLTVREGIHKPYLYKSKAYRRNDSATIEVDRVELTRLILKGQNLTFEEMQAREQNLTFHSLEEKLIDVLKLKTVTQDTMKTLELYNDDEGYNIAGELLADNNRFNGIDIIRFGSDINTLLNRKSIQHISLLKQYDQTIEFYRMYYKYEKIEGSSRTSVELLPEEAFREAIANALVHRTWDINASINIAMFEDRVEITSPGGLPEGMNQEEYMRGGLSILRNRIIANIFFRLHMIEHFGTGIRRIQEAYENSITKPKFEISQSSIRIILPVLKEKLALTDDENVIYELIKKGRNTSSVIVNDSGYGKTKVVTLLNKMNSEGYIRKVGNGRGTHYILG